MYLHLYIYTYIYIINKYIYIYIYILFMENISRAAVAVAGAGRGDSSRGSSRDCQEQGQQQRQQQCQQHKQRLRGHQQLGGRLRWKTAIACDRSRCDWPAIGRDAKLPGHSRDTPGTFPGHSRVGFSLTPTKKQHVCGNLKMLVGAFLVIFW